MTERSEMEAAIEAVLFVSSEPVPRGRLIELFDEDERELASEVLDSVLSRYGAGDGRGVMAEDVAGGVRLATRPEMATWLRRFFDVASGSKLSMAALETLAIVAYRQPITGPEIQELRGVSPSGVIKTLLERRMVRIAGRKEVVGKPFLYATTREFLVHFGLNSLRDLPPLEDFEEAFGGGHEAAAALGGLIGMPSEAELEATLGAEASAEAGLEPGAEGRFEGASETVAVSDAEILEADLEAREAQFVQESEALTDADDESAGGGDGEPRDDAEEGPDADPSDVRDEIAEHDEDDEDDDSVETP